MTIAKETQDLLAKLREMHPSVTFNIEELGDYADRFEEGEVAPAHLITFLSAEDDAAFVDPYSNELGRPAEPDTYGLSKEAAELIVAHNRIRF